MLQRPLVLHLHIHGAIATGSQGQVALGFDDYSAIVVDCGDASLGEEVYAVGVVSEVFVLLEEVDYLLVVHVTGHDVPLYHVFVGEWRLMVGLLGDLHQSLQFPGKILE